MISWLADVGKLSTLCGCASALFSLASAGGGYLSNHKAGVNPTVFHQERRQLRHMFVHHQRNAPL